MSVLAHIVLFICILQPYDTIAVIISINQNITGLAGKNDTYLTCSFTEYVNQNFLNIAIVSRNKQGIFPLDEPIVVFPPGKEAFVHPSAKYLLERVTLTNITHMSTHATIKFDNLKCEDEKDYICTLTYIDEFSISKTVRSDPTSISVKVSSSKPDNISSVIVWSAHSKKQEITSSTFLREADTVTFTCTGNIGNPPGKFIWQMYSPQHNQLIVYTNATTEKEEKPENCTFRGTSNITVHLTPDHFEAKYCCFEESKKDVAGMYVETEPLNIHFQVNHVNISKQPNQKQYGPKSDKITLICEGNGNPEPHFKWFKKENINSILSNKSFYDIDNVIQNNSGVYICEVYNIIYDVIYRKSKSVEIDIVHVDELPSSKDLSLLKTALVYVIPVVCVVLFTVICVAVIKHWCIRPKKKENEENYYQTLSRDGITVNAEYTSVIHTPNRPERESGTNLVCSNGKEENENKSRKKDELQTGYLTCIQVTGSTIVNGPNNYEDLIVSDRTIVYDEINQQTILNNEVSKAQMSVSTDNGDHYDSICMNVAIQSSVNDGEKVQEENFDISQNLPTSLDNIYAVPCDTLQTETATCKIIKARGKNEHDGVSDKDAVYSEVYNKANMKSEMSKDRTSVHPENVDHNGDGISVD